MSTYPSVLRADRVTVALGGALVLDDVDVTVCGGELVALVGPNGAGKSTLLGALAGDFAVSSGAVTLDGRPVSSHSARGLARHRAVLLQQQRLAFGFDVRDVVAMGRSPWHRTERANEDAAVIERVMRRAEVDRFAQRRYPTLSGGEQARTSFARVLAQTTPVLLLDEPTAALDIRHQEAVLGVAREAARAGVAVVVVLHDLSLAAAYADRICVLADGAKRADGVPRDVLDPALLGEIYRHPVEVIDHNGTPVVVPVRTEVPCARAH